MTPPHPVKLRQVPLLIWEILHGFLLYPALVGILFRPKGLTYQRNLFYAIARVVSNTRVLIQFRKRRTTFKSYKYFVKKNGYPERTTTLSHDALLCWFGSPQAEHIVYYLHGGAYVSPAGSGHYVVLQNLVEEAEKRGKSLGVAVLNYGLTPDSRYPTQLIQATVGLRHLIEQHKVSPSKLIIAGDSAGGNMALGLISHLLHPHPTIPPFALPTSSPVLLGVFLISPAVSFETTSSTWKSNADKDVMTPYVLHKTIHAFVDDSNRDWYNEPVRTSPEWWQDVPAKAMKLSYGSYELFAEDCREVGRKLQVHNPRMEIVETPHEVHCQPMIDAMLEGKAGPSADLLRGWIMDAIA